jgi:hypothetical protein
MRAQGCAICQHPSLRDVALASESYSSPQRISRMFPRTAFALRRGLLSEEDVAEKLRQRNVSEEDGRRGHPGVHPQAVGGGLMPRGNKRRKAPRERRRKDGRRR